MKREREPSPPTVATGSSLHPDAIVAQCKSALAQLCAEHGIDESHGVKHAAAVLSHTEKALATAEAPLSDERALAVRLAALLHDADDKKYFGKESAKNLTNAARIMAEADAPPSAVEDVLRMIHLVSCSANGNSCPPEARAEPELLWPRWADRLEAAGEIGVARCYMHSRHAGEKLCCDDGPNRRVHLFGLSNWAPILCTFGLLG